MAYPAFFTLVGDRAEHAMIEVPISSITVTVGELLELVDGAATWTAATATSNARTLKGVAQEAASSAATVVKVLLCGTSQLWVAATTNNADSAHVGDRMVLTDANTVNNTGSDNTGAAAVFQMLAVSGATTDKRIIGRFTGLYGNATV